VTVRPGRAAQARIRAAKAAVAVAAFSTAGAAWGDGAPPVSLQEAVRLTLLGNPTFLVAREEIARAQGLLEQARAQSIPIVGATGNLQQLNTSRSFEGFVTQPATQVNFTGTLTVPLVNPRAWALWSHAGENVDVAKASAYDTRRTIAVATGHAYLAVLAQKRVLEANLRSRETARAHLEDAHARYAAGASGRVDEVRAGQVLAADEALVETSQAAVVTAQEALGVLAGRSTALDAKGDPNLAPVPPFEQGLAMAGQQRSDVVAANERLRYAHAVHRDNWTELGPSLTGSFQVFYQDPPTSLLTTTTGWQAELFLNVPIFDGGYTCGTGKERAALEREADVALDGVVRQARSDVRATYSTLLRARSALPQTREASRLANEALVLTTRAYMAGQSTNIEVIDAEQTARDADIAAEVAADTERQATLDALAAVGLFP
jgi:outer membrane protein